MIVAIEGKQNHRRCSLTQMTCTNNELCKGKLIKAQQHARI